MHPLCDDIDRGGGYCWMHTQRKRLGRDMDAPKRSRKRTPLIDGGHVVGEIINGRRLDERAEPTRFGQTQWYWICSLCGQRQGPSTVAHLNRSVKCKICAMKRENNPRWLGYKQLTGVWLWTYRDSAHKRGLVWEVTPEQIWAVWLRQDGRCAYTGWQLTHGVDASLDRIDSAVGYTVGNIQFVHRDINRMKSNFSEKHFWLLCESVTKHKVTKDIAGFDEAVPSLISDFVRGL